MAMSLKAPAELDKALEKLHKMTEEVPQEIKDKAERVLKFCRAELPEDGKEWRFPLGIVHYEAGYQTVLTMVYELRYRADWESGYHDSSWRTEVANIFRIPHFNSGFYPYESKVEK